MPKSIGEIITFYSYKGGAGRSMILANVGYLLSSPEYRNRHVLLIDWDLEAPGLERFFSTTADPSKPGLVDYLVQMESHYRSSAPGTKLPESMARDPRAVEIFRAAAEEYPLGSYITPLKEGSHLWLMSAGRRSVRYPDGSAGYWEKVRKFDLDDFYSNYGSFFTHFRELLMTQFDYVLIDSRTGLTDIGGICTRVMPEKLILVFAPNHQNIDGAVGTARKSIRYRMASRDPRPLIIYPVAARIDASASQLRTTWWRGGAIRNEQIIGYQEIFEELLREMYGLDACDLGTYFNATQVPYDSDYAFGEAIAADIDGTNDRLGIGYACDQLVRRLVEQVAPWEGLAEQAAPGEEPAAPIDFVVSYAGADRAWAEWVAWQLSEAGYAVELDVWDLAAGRTFVSAMGGALERCDRVVALLSAAYFEPSRYTEREFSSSPAQLLGSAAGRLVPVQVEALSAEEVPPVLRRPQVPDLSGVAEEAARQALLRAVAGAPRQPDAAPRAVSRLGGSGPPLPGSARLPRVWNVPARNLVFAGRDELLVRVREQLLSADRAVVEALYGMSGVGKTQLAVQYAHQFAGDYDIVWWVDAKRPELIGEQLAALAVELDSAKPATEVEVAVGAALAELRSRGRWLLVFDNAEDPEELAKWLPGGTAGHVLITSRVGGWQHIAVAERIHLFAPKESVAVLKARVPGLSESDADRLAAKLGHFPLAVRQAARYMIGTGTGLDEYLRLLDTKPAELLSEAESRYPGSFTGVVRLAVDRLTADDPAAAALVMLCAFLAPEPEPIPPPDWFAAAAEKLPDALRARVASPVAFYRSLELIGNRGLARIDRHGLYMHRLTQVVLRDQLGPPEAAVMRASADAILIENFPGDAADPSTWPTWARLLPHVLVADLATTMDEEVRRLACWGSLYLLERGDTRGGRDLADNLYQQWRDRFGGDDFYTIWAASNLARAFREEGRYDEARRLDEDSLARNRRLHGDDDPQTTLHSAGHLAADLRSLGEVHAARDLDQDAFARRSRRLGPDHRDTLGSAYVLALDLHKLGDVRAARELDEDTLARRRRVLGEDDPDTLNSASSLAADLRALDRVQAARDLGEDILTRRRRILGIDHPYTLASAYVLAADLRALGDVKAARELDEDTLVRRRRVLGEDHPDTRASAASLAADLRVLGDT